MFNLKNIILLVCLSLTSAGTYPPVVMLNTVGPADPEFPILDAATSGMPSDEDIAAHEAARAEAAKVMKNPKHGHLFAIKNYLEEATEKIADGNLNTAKDEIKTAIGWINDYCEALIAKIEDKNANEVLTEQDAYNIRAIIDSSKDVYRLMAETIMQKNEEFDLNIHRILSLEKLYLFEQKGGENYLDLVQVG